MTESTREPEAQVIVDTAIASAGPTTLDDDGRFLGQVVPRGATYQVVDLEQHREALRGRPRRKKGWYNVHDVPSFAAYFAKHGHDESEVWADSTQHVLVAVLNANGEATGDSEVPDDGAQWEDHRLNFAVKKTDAWKAWKELDGKLVDQVTFAEHIEARSIDIFDPSAAEMLEIAQTFQAKTGVDFESSQLLSNGERQLTYVENTTAKAGQKGHLEIPTQIEVRLVPFEGAAQYPIKARFRYRITGGRLQLGYVLERPDDVIREAFLDVVDSVQDAISHPILRGVPQ